MLEVEFEFDFGIGHLFWDGLRVQMHARVRIRDRLCALENKVEVLEFQFQFRIGNVLGGGGEVCVRVRVRDRLCALEK